MDTLKQNIKTEDHLDLPVKKKPWLFFFGLNFILLVGTLCAFIEPIVAAIMMIPLGIINVLTAIGALIYRLRHQQEATCLWAYLIGATVVVGGGFFLLENNPTFIDKDTVLVVGTTLCFALSVFLNYLLYQLYRGK